MRTLRERPFCSSPDPELRSFKFERQIRISAITCGCGASIILMDDEAAAAWQLRKKTDQLLHACLPILRVFILLCGSHDVKPDQEIALLQEVIRHLSKGGQP
jgi:hypothetical protein